MSASLFWPLIQLSYFIETQSSINYSLEKLSKITWADSDMKSRIIGFALFFLAVINHFLIAAEFPLNQLKKIADGLNIEGGTIYQRYLRQGQIWANLCIVLDRPFEDGVEWQELKNSNNFPLKEAVVLDYNESQVNFTYATVMHYYITHAHQILDKPTNQIAKILIQVHRNTSGPRHTELLEQLLCECYPDIEKIKQTTVSLSKSKYELFSYFFPNMNVQVDYCYGVAPENLGTQEKYNDKDIILSFSLVAGLHPEWKSGSLLIPDQHIPFYLKNVRLAIDEKYIVQNHLNQILYDLIKNQSDEVLQTINDHFYSFNPQKRRAKKLLQEDFKNATLLQVDDLFNPSQLPQTFNLDSVSPVVWGQASMS